MPKELKLANQFFFSVRNREKTTTIRDEDKGIERGDEVWFISPDLKESCLVKITKVISILFQNISHEEVLQEGFYSLDDLQTALKEFYPEIADNSVMYSLHFRLLDIGCSG